MKLIGKNRISEKNIYLSLLPEINTSSFPELPNQYFGAFLACHAKSFSDQAILEFADYLVKRGLAYVDCWGEDCERVHDLFDDVIIRNDPAETNESVRLTTWHSNTTLDEALWNFLNVSFPAADYWDECKTEVIVIVGNIDWARQIQTRVANQKILTLDVVEG